MEALCPDPCKTVSVAEDLFQFIYHGGEAISFQSMSEGVPFLSPRSLGGHSE
jgi:hypothetical protein